VAVYLALGDSISIDEYTGVHGGGPPSQLARKLGLELVDATLQRLHQIAQRIQPLDGRVIVNTIYDPSDGDNDVGRRELGLSRLPRLSFGDG
jgi:hypothetical protein